MLQSFGFPNTLKWILLHSFKQFPDANSIFTACMFMITGFRLNILIINYLTSSFILIIKDSGQEESCKENGCRTKNDRQVGVKRTSELTPESISKEHRGQAHPGNDDHPEDHTDQSVHRFHIFAHITQEEESQNPATEDGSQRPPRVQCTFHPVEGQRDYNT